MKSESAGLTKGEERGMSLTAAVEMTAWIGKPYSSSRCSAMDEVVLRERNKERAGPSRKGTILTLRPPMLNHKFAARTDASGV